MRELFFRDAQLAHQALERILPARGHRDLGQVALRLPRRQAQRLIGNGLVHTRLHAADVELSTPVAHLDHERNVSPDRHVLQHEVAVCIRERRGDRRAADLAAAAGARRERLELCIRHVDHRVVQGELTRRDVHRAR